MDAIPPVCQPLQDKIKESRELLADEKIPADGTPAEKAAAGRRINALRQAISRLEQQLRECIANPPPPPPPPPPTLRPSLGIPFLEVVQCIQRPNKSVRLIRGKPTAVRMFVSSGVTGGHDAGAGPNVWPNVTGRLTITDLDTGSDLVTNLSPSNPGGNIDAQPTIDRNNGTHSLNFRLPLSALRSGNVRVRARAFVDGHENDPTPGRTTSSEVVVSFIARDQQKILPILVGDGLRGVPPPSLAQFSTALFTGAWPRFPTAGFVVNPPITHISRYLLTSWLGWTQLLAEISTMILVGPQYEGIRCAVVPAAPDYPQCGMGVPRVWPFGQPAFVVDVSDVVCFAHEMGHAFGVHHSVCRGDEPWPVDDRLGSVWARTDEPGMDVAMGTVVPRGTPDIMSYCAGNRWPSTRSYGLIFDQGPI